MSNSYRGTQSCHPSVNDGKPRSKRKDHRKRPSKHTPLLSEGIVLKKKYEIQNMIGAGGYGQIYKAYYPHADVHVAVKIMQRVHDPQRMILEQQILLQLKGKPGFPKLCGSGSLDSFMYIVMDLLGKSLSDLRKRSNKKRFDPPTAIRVGIQSLTALQSMHELGFVHRDIKPANMCVGVKDVQTIYLVDFGLARQFRVNGKLFKRSRASFRGTLRYVSINVHDKKDQTPADDLISLYYTIVELSEETLPWTKLKQHDFKEIAYQKKTSVFADICTQQPESLGEFYSLCYDECDDPHRPPYENIHEILKKCLPSDFDPKTPYSYEYLLNNEKETESSEKRRNESTKRESSRRRSGSDRKASDRKEGSKKD